MIRATLTIKGKVQMVGYRVAVERIARRMRLVGYVKNIPNGNVKVVCEGEIKDVDDFIKLITIKNDLISVESIERKQETATGEFKEFTVKIDERNNMQTIIELASAQNTFILNTFKKYEELFEQVREPMMAAAKASEYLSNILPEIPRIQQVQKFISPTNLMIDQSATEIYEQQAKTMTAVVGCIETYPSLVLPTEMLRSLREQEQPLLKAVLRENQERELLPDIEEVITELHYHIANLPIFDKQKDFIKSGIESYKSKNFPSAFSTLLNPVEGVVREIFFSENVGGTDLGVIQMIEQLRIKKWVQNDTAYLIRGALERDKVDHALGGVYRDYPFLMSNVTLGCLLNLARDYIYFRVLRLCFKEIVKQPTYSRTTVETLLGQTNKRGEANVDCNFVNIGSSLTIRITLYSRDVFEFECNGPLWGDVRLIKNFVILK